MLALPHSVLEQIVEKYETMCPLICENAVTYSAEMAGADEEVCARTMNAAKVPPLIFVSLCRC